MSFTAPPPKAGEGISHKLRLAFVAEFLEPLSPACLGILYQRTCVGLRYGKNVLLNETFLERRTICVALWLPSGLPITPRLNVITDFPIITILKLRSRLATRHRHVPFCHSFESESTRPCNGISTVFTSSYPRLRGTRLRSDLPEGDERCFGNLAHSA